MEHTSSKFLFHQKLSIFRQLSNFDGFRSYLELGPLGAGRVRPDRVLPGPGDSLQLLLHLAAQLELADVAVLALGGRRQRHLASKPEMYQEFKTLPSLLLFLISLR